VFNCVHQREIGGLEPGGLVQSARDVYAEPTFMPPVKIAEAGELREDLVEAWVRRSRLPDLMTLELNSQISGVRLGLRRLSELVERYGKATVKRVMHRMIGDTSRVVASRLLSLPDAVWRDERYVAGASQGDMRLYRLCMQFEKRADRLRVSNWGTDAATGSINCTAGIFRAGVLNALLPTIAYDQYLCAAGVLRQLDFDVDTNAITSASHPAAVSTSMGSLLVINQAHALATKMVSGNDTLAPHAFATSSGHSFSSNTVFGIDQYGKPYSDALLDTLGGGLGAFSHRDGIDFGGRVTGVGGRFADVERFERVVPFLYLYRRVLRDSGGHGRWRGGATLAAAWLGHKTNESYIASGGLVKSVTTGKGAVGAYPATSGSHWHATDCDVEAWKSAGRFPADPGELRRLAPHGSLAPAKKYDNRLGATDVFELVGNPGAGWGDPLDRDPALVADDVRRRRLSHEDARRVYAVVLTEDGTVDDDATAACRRATREERLFRAGPPLAEPPAVATDVPSVEQPLPAVSETVAMLRVDGTTSLLVCRRCHAPLGDGHHGYRRGCAKLDMDLEDIGPYYTSPRDEVQVRLVYRQYLCPRCGSIVDGDVCRAEDEPYNDLRLL
ncbi:MAG TPA: hydantoinase B/oxoprolinase family protein, partial [Acidimicrobiales bacterium]